jgi:hypothetical protein
MMALEHRLRLKAVLAVTTLLGGCETTVVISQPAAGDQNNPVPSSAGNGQANSVTLNQPAPVGALTIGYIGKQAVTSKVLTVTLDGANIPLSALTPAPAGGVTSSFPLSFTAHQQHLLVAAVNCGGLACDASSWVVFTVPTLDVAKSIYDLPPYQITSSAVMTEYDVSKALSVTLTEININSQPKVLRFGLDANHLQAVGQPLTVIIPATSNMAPFFVETDSPGVTYNLLLSAPGCDPQTIYAATGG